jgi:lantibiotic biosynthesis protein
MTNQLQEKTKQIVAVISNHDFNSLSILSGDSGSLFLLCYYAEYTKDEKYLEIVEEKILTMYDRIQEGNIYVDFGYSNGVSGFLWALHNLNESGHIDIDLKENFEDTLPLIYDFIFTKINEGNFDFFHGALGPANLLINTIDMFPNNLIVLHDFNKMLLKIGIEDQEKNTLHYVSNVLKGSDRYEAVINLSYSHGMAAIIYYFSRCLQHKELSTPEIKIALEQMINFYKINQNKPSPEMSYFPSWVNLENHIEHKSRLAWCYGDLGIGIALYEAAKVLDDNMLKNYAIEVLKHTTKRTNLSEENVVEGNFCHGSAGLVETYKTIYELTKEEIFIETANYWLQVTLDLGNHEDGYGGYKTYFSSNNTYENNGGLLEGATGVALVFLETLMGKSLAWKKSLMLS